MGTKKQKNMGVPYFTEMESWEAAAKKNASASRQQRAQDNNFEGALKKMQQIQVTPGKWKTK